MNFLNGDHLRVVTPVTTNGELPKLDEQGMQVYKETFLPLTAKKALMEQNQGLPKHLQKIIEVVSNEAAQPAAESAETQATQVMAKTEGAKRFHHLGRAHLNTLVKTSGPNN